MRKLLHVRVTQSLSARTHIAIIAAPWSCRSRHGEGGPTGPWLCLQEIKATHAQIPDPLTTLHEYWSYWHGGPKGYSGVSLHFLRSRFPDTPEFTHPGFDTEYRVVDALIGVTRFASVYVPNGGKDYAAKIDFLSQLELWTAEKQAAGERLIVCGDLNVALTDADVHPSQVKPGMIGQRSDERALLHKAIDHGLVDLIRTTHRGDVPVFTWWPPWRDSREKNIGWRIDFVLVADALAAKVRSCEIRKGVIGSDHGPVVVVIDD